MTAAPGVASSAGSLENASASQNAVESVPTDVPGPRGNTVDSETGINTRNTLPTDGLHKNDAGPAGGSRGTDGTINSGLNTGPGVLSTINGGGIGKDNDVPGGGTDETDNGGTGGGAGVLDIVTETGEDLKRFQVKRWTACSFWLWDVMHDTCVICRNNMMSLCIHCQAKIGTCPLEDMCAVAWGVCNHAYHFHCIKRWLETSAHPRCPLDNSEWEFRQIGR